jgi:hypothetical protein
MSKELAKIIKNNQSSATIVQQSVQQHSIRFHSQNNPMAQAGGPVRTNFDE